MMKICYDTLDIDGLSITDAIAALYSWENEHPDAEDDILSFNWDGDDPYLEVVYKRPMNAEEIEFAEKHQAAMLDRQEQYERETYERLKAKFEGN